MQATLLGNFVNVNEVAEHLDAHHYLGRARRGIAWVDEHGVMVLASPTSRHLPHKGWLELTRWCLTGEPNGGSRQFAKVKRAILAEFPHISTIVSYSDPSVGHTGALYRACNWLWAPTWQRLRPPPSGGGSWDGVQIQAPKDRWVYPLRPDPQRAETLQIRDDSVKKKFPEAQYTEPKWKGNRWSK